MIKNLRKAFTIIELVIVIAVIAVLAAVLIPTFSSLVDKANESVDTQLIRNLNIALKADVTNGEKHKTMHSALLCAKDAGYDIQKINAQGADNEILWDSVNDVFCYYDSKDGKVKYVPESNIEEGSVNDVDYFKMYEEMPDISNQTYSIYLNNDSTITEITVTVGFDAGNNNNITIIKYNGVDEVIIRTLGSCKFIVSGTVGTVHHYGAAASESGEHDCHADVIDGSEYTEDNLRNLQFAGGKGTEESPYLVASDEQFKAFLELDQNNYRYIKLINDVEFVGTSRKNTFKGILDGNGHAIYYDIDSDPYLFYDTNEKAEIKNLEWICKGDNISALIAFPYLNVTYDNVVAKSETVISSQDYGISPFCVCVYNNTNCYFKNCISEINYSLSPGGTTEAYGGIFIGNYVMKNSFISFENCINKGKVTGQYLGFFVGNTTRSIKLTDSPEPTYDSDVATIYVKDCKNEGLMVGTACVAAFASNTTETEKETSHKNASENVVNNGSFIPNQMYVKNIGSAFENNGNKYLTIKSSNNSLVSYYKIGCGTSMTFKNSSSSAFTYTEEVQASKINEYKFIIIKSILEKNDFSDYANYDEETNGQYSYIIVSNGDGTRSIIVDVNSNNFIKFSSDLKIYIAAYDSDGFMIGYDVCKVSEIPTK